MGTDKVKIIKDDDNNEDVNIFNLRKIHQAQNAYNTYYARCFWSNDPKLKITINDIEWVGEQLLKHGGRDVWELGRFLCR